MWYLSTSSSIHLLFIMSQITVWTQLEEYEPEEVEVSTTATVDDIKQKLLNEYERKSEGNFPVFFKTEQLSPGQQIPRESSRTEPIMVKYVPLPDTNSGRIIVLIYL